MTTTPHLPAPEGAARPTICRAWIPLRQVRDLAEVAGRRARLALANDDLAAAGLRVAPLISMPGCRWVPTTAGWVAAIPI